MLDVRAAILAVSLAILLTAASSAQVPSPTLSTIELDPQDTVLAGLSTCPSGDANPFQYIKITVLDSGGNPIPGIPYSDFFFWPSADVIFFHAYFTPETDAAGVIYFEVIANEAILHPSMGGAPVVIGVNVGTVMLAATVSLTCNTYDYDLSGSVTPPDFGTFASDFGTHAQRSDFTWSGGQVNPADFAYFAAHFGH
jgi:hypothetical protein